MISYVASMIGTLNAVDKLKFECSRLELLLASALNSWKFLSASEGVY